MLAGIAFQVAIHTGASAAMTCHPYQCRGPSFFAGALMEVDGANGLAPAGMGLSVLRTGVKRGSKLESARAMAWVNTIARVAMAIGLIRSLLGCTGMAEGSLTIAGRILHRRPARPWRKADQ